MVSSAMCQSFVSSAVKFCH